MKVVNCDYWSMQKWLYRCIFMNPSWSFQMRWPSVERKTEEEAPVVLSLVEASSMPCKLNTSEALSLRSLVSTSFWMIFSISFLDNEHFGIETRSLFFKELKIENSLIHPQTQLPNPSLLLHLYKLENLNLFMVFKGKCSINAIYSFPTANKNIKKNNSLGDFILFPLFLWGRLEF